MAPPTKHTPTDKKPSARMNKTLPVAQKVVTPNKDKKAGTTGGKQPGTRKGSQESGQSDSKPVISQQSQREPDLLDIKSHKDEKSVSDSDDRSQISKNKGLQSNATRDSKGKNLDTPAH